jgi:PKD domain-containing protein
LGSRYWYVVPAFYTMGNLTLRVRAMDYAGNWNSTGWIEILVYGNVPTDTTPPVAQAGDDRTVTAGDTIVLNATGSYDDVGIVNHTWAISDGGAPWFRYGSSLVITTDEAGILVVTLTVRDAAGNSGTDTVTITIGADDPAWTVHVGPFLFANGTAVVGAQVSLGPVTATTDDEGLATFPHMSAGTHAGMATYQGRTVTFNVTVSAEGAVSASLPFMPGPGGTLVVRVGPVLTTDGDLLVGASVTITYSGKTDSGTTGGDGIARLEIAASAVGSDVYLVISKPGYETAHSVVTVTADGHLTGGLPLLRSTERTNDQEDDGVDVRPLVWLAVGVVVMVVGFVVFKLWEEPPDDEEDEVSRADSLDGVERVDGAASTGTPSDRPVWTMADTGDLGGDFDLDGDAGGDGDDLGPDDDIDGDAGGDGDDLGPDDDWEEGAGDGELASELVGSDDAGEVASGVRVDAGGDDTTDGSHSVKSGNKGTTIRSGRDAVGKGPSSGGAVTRSGKKTRVKVSRVRKGRSATRHSRR